MGLCGTYKNSSECPSSFCGWNATTKNCTEVSASFNDYFLSNTPSYCLPGTDVENNEKYCKSVDGKCQGSNNSTVKGILYASESNVPESNCAKDCSKNNDCIGYMVLSDKNKNKSCTLYGENLEISGYDSIIPNGSNMIMGNSGDQNYKCVVKNQKFKSY